MEQKQKEMAKLEKDKKREGITPDVEPIPTKLKTAAFTSPQMAQFFPEPGVLVEIPLNMVKTLYSLKSLLPGSRTPESTQKMIDRAKQRCLDNVTRQHPETTNILDDMKKLQKALEAAKERQIQEPNASQNTGAANTSAARDDKGKPTKK